jgi:hypothetical protein
MTAEREIYSGRTLLGIIRERDDGAFVAMLDEQVLGPFDTIAAATDAVLDLARAGVGQ